jgi:Monogalactosyldiacylglycerol (MGDG) synthase.
MKKVHFFFFDAGGGHRSAATALKAVLEQQGRPWEVRLVKLQEILESLDIFKKLTGIRMEDVYNKLLKRGWTLGSEYLVPIMHAIIRMYHPSQRRMLAEFWRRDRPDMVSASFPTSTALSTRPSRTSTPTSHSSPSSPIADFPPHFWMERQDQYLICGTDKAVEQARATGFPPEKIFRTRA